MKIPRIRIAWVMFAVAIIAVDFATIRACFDSPSSWSEYLLVGALPMANVLGVGLLIAQRRPGCRPFLLGFEIFGSTSLTLYIVLVSCFSAETVDRYLDLALEPVYRIVGLDPPRMSLLAAIFVAAVLIGCPQLVFALIGGFLSRRYRVDVTRR